jgi:hypothetical protein
MLYQTAAFTGLRRGELVALRWGEVDFENDAIRVFEGYTRNRRGRTKSRKARTVPMVQEVATLLSGLRERGHHAGRTDLVFVNEEGGHIDASALRRRYVAAREEAGIRPLRSTIWATSSGRWRSTAPRSSRSRHGWATPTSRPRCATCTTRAMPTTPNCYPAHSNPRLRHHRSQVRRLESPCRLATFAFRTALGASPTRADDPPEHEISSPARRSSPQP